MPAVRTALTASLSLAAEKALNQRAIWRDAALAWVGQRVLVMGLVGIWQFLVLQQPPASFYRVWISFDGGWYSEIARGGYSRLLDAAFYPLFPFLEHLLAPLVGGNVDVAGLVIANAAGFGALLLLRLLVELELGARVARRTLLYLVVFPTTMFFLTEYTESLFLLLAVATFLALRRRSWLLAGALVALATLTRGTGLALLAPLVLSVSSHLRHERSSEMAQSRREWAELLAAGLLPVVTFSLLQIGLSLRFGVWDAAALAEHHWSRSLDWPWVGLVQSVRMVLTQPWPSIAALDLAFALLWLGLSCALLLPSGPRLPAPYVAYTWTTLLLVLATPVHSPDSSPFTSIARYMLVAFPCFVCLAHVSLRSRYVHWGMLAASTGQLVALTWIFARGILVA